ncbi:MAG TPA: molybdate ABC transporter substrate-binding protein [bacterium]|nr:molybdate ABC transporter substrate-binding protein [bacterium]
MSAWSRTSITPRLPRPLAALLAGLLLGALLGLLPPPARADSAHEVRVAVAANFTTAMRRLAAEFQQESGYALSASYASTGTLYAQIRHGAPFDVFLAADVRRPHLLELDGLGVSGSRFTYAVGRLALWSAKPGFMHGSEQVLNNGGFRALAIANPRTAPYGAAAQQVLQHLGLWAPLQGRIVQGENIAQTYQYVASGNAALGFVALSQLKAAHPHADAWLPPEGWYRPIEQQALLLRHGAQSPAARAFLTFLRGPRARRVIETLGYGLPAAAGRDTVQAAR